MKRRLGNSGEVFFQCFFIHCSRLGSEFSFSFIQCRTPYMNLCVCVCVLTVCAIYDTKNRKFPLKKDEFMLDRAIDILFVLITHIVVALKRAHIDLLETLSLSFIFFAAISHLAIPKFFV